MLSFSKSLLAAVALVSQARSTDLDPMLELGLEVGKDVSTAVVDQVFGSDQFTIYNDFFEAIQGWGYSDFEVHKVHTKDGYNLTMFRLYPRTRPKNSATKNPILMVPPRSGLPHEWLKAYHHNYAGN